jgi:hypothetical protein
MGNILNKPKEDNLKDNLKDNSNISISEYISDNDTIEFNYKELNLFSDGEKPKFKDLLYVIDDTNKIMHFYKSLKHVKHIPIIIKALPNYEKFSNKSIEFFEKYKNNIIEDFELFINGINIHNYYDVALFINNIDIYYKSTHHIKKRKFLESTYNLLHLTLYLLINDELLE